MDNILISLQELEGVNGVFVADATGKLVGFRAHSVYDGELLQRASKLVANAIDSLKLLQDDWNAVTAQFSEGKLLIRNLGGKDVPVARSGVLVVVADASLNVSFAGVALRVAVTKLKTLFESRGEILTNSVGCVPELGATNGLAASAPRPNVTTPGITQPGESTSINSARIGSAEVATSGLSWSGLAGTSSMSGSGVMVADSASSNFLSTCTSALARAVGPMAKFYVKDAVRKLCPSKPFSRDYSELLVEELVKCIKKPDDVVKFRSQLRKPV